jgi:alpha-1,3-rhamnosyltransferase
MTFDLRSPTLSVIMSSYNHEQIIEQAIKSLLPQSMQDLELIVVDDFSRDRSGGIEDKMNNTEWAMYFTRDKSRSDRSNDVSRS